MKNKCEALLGVAYPGVRDNHSTVYTKTGYDDDMMIGDRASGSYNVSSIPDLAK